MIHDNNRSSNYRRDSIKEEIKDALSFTSDIKEMKEFSSKAKAAIFAGTLKQMYHMCTFVITPHPTKRKYIVIDSKLSGEVKSIMAVSELCNFEAIKRQCNLVEEHMHEMQTSNLALDLGIENMLVDRSSIENGTQH